ncbi:kinase-like domain-containing protein [Echria macrotheca]|uniref:Kinase-like domain-containing protein n=1 Tax=Echria macrotheca TaxID=438768 RepID=A0AAJ0BLJ4_9PEZI|nr:kinase-like domain-containing protein [Echria macrotheca]
MAMPTPVPVTLSGGKVPSSSVIRDILATFLTEEWPAVNPSSLKISYRTSFANDHCTVERPKPAAGTPAEPLKLFIKFCKETAADIEVFKHLFPTKEDETQLCYRYGQSGLGPKVYGSFRTLDGTLGRIEQFLDARNLEPEDVENESIRADIANALARFHVMETTLERKAAGQFYEALISGLTTYHGKGKLKVLGKEGGVSLDRLIEYDFSPRLTRVVDALESIRAKQGWCLHDMQYMNVMVKNDPGEEESKVVLIDLECVTQNYRAFDIGGHFMQKTFKWFDDENKIANCGEYTEEEKKHFCDVYARQWNELTGESDTMDQVFRESEYGYVLAVAFDIHNMLCFMDMEDDSNPLNLLGLQKLFEMFVSQCTRLGLETV